MSCFPLPRQLPVLVLGEVERARKDVDHELEDFFQEESVGDALRDVLELLIRQGESQLYIYREWRVLVSSGAY